MKHFSCFSGIAGLDIASELAGFETVGQVEIADYPTKHVLEKYWPDVPRWRDIRNVTEESLKEKGIENVTVVSGGFPCQPYSIAGKRKGKEDDRYLWPELIRVLGCIKPSWFIGENVAGITSMEQSENISELEGEEVIKRYCERLLPQFIEDLKKEGFLLPRYSDGTPIIFVIPACAVNAPHRRMRIFLIAYNADNSNNNRVRRGSNGDTTGCECSLQVEGPSGDVTDSKRLRELQQKRSIKDQWGRIGDSCQNVTDPTSVQFCREPSTGGDEVGLCSEGEFASDSDDAQTSRQRRDCREIYSITESKGFDVCNWQEPWIEVATRLCRVDDGIPTGVDGINKLVKNYRLYRLKCLGNAVVPQQVYPIFKYIAEIEKSMR